MNISVRLHPASLPKYAEWRDSLPGSPEDISLLLNACFEDLGAKAVAHAKRRRLGSAPFCIEGPDSQWFLVAVNRLGRSTREVLILDLIDPPDDRASR